jgi:hypothetical protein
MTCRTAILIVTTALPLAACPPSAVRRPLEPIGWTLRAGAADLAPGTALVDAFRQLRAAGVTNLSNPLTSFVESARDGRGYFALAGDQLDQLLIFVDGRFWRGQPIARTLRAQVHGVRLRSASARPDIAFVVVSRVTAYGEPAGLQLVAPGVATMRYDLTLLALENEGLRDPLFIGRDLGTADGIAYKAYFTARRADGAVWPRAYLLDAAADRLLLEPAPAQAVAEAQLCSCYQAWRDGVVPPSFEEALAGAPVLR